MNPRRGRANQMHRVFIDPAHIMSFNALVLEESEGKIRAGLQRLDESALPQGDVTVRVSHSTLNYKDGLAITGKAPVVRRFPMIPGIDFAGIVESSSHPDFKPGDAVVLNVAFSVGDQIRQAIFQFTYQ